MARTIRGTRTASYIGSSFGGVKNEPVERRKSSCSAARRKAGKVTAFL